LSTVVATDKTTNFTTNLSAIKTTNESAHEATNYTTFASAIKAANETALFTTYFPAIKTTI